MVEAHAATTIVNEAGLHARPCHAIVSLAMEYRSDLRVACGGQAVNGRSVLELMTLAAGPGDCLELTAVGPDATELVSALQELIAMGFSE